jgi:hypothetical protein
LLAALTSWMIHTTAATLTMMISETVQLFGRNGGSVRAGLALPPTPVRPSFGGSQLRGLGVVTSQD